MTRSVRVAFVLVLALSIAGLTACGGGGGSDVAPSLPPTEPTVPVEPSEPPTEPTEPTEPVEPPTGLSLSLPAGHGLAAGQFTVQPGASDKHGNVVVSCPAGGSACIVDVAADGTATYDRTGGVPSVMAAYGLWELPSGHGLVAGQFTVQPRASDKHGNVVVSCPAGGSACIVDVTAGGTATYDQTGGVPTVVAAYGPWTLPSNHGLVAGRFTVQPGASDEYGNVVVSCPAGGSACVVAVAADGTATYARTGGVPNVMAARTVSGPLPLPRPPETGDLKVVLTGYNIHARPWGYTIQAGSDETIHGLNFACPSGGPNCKVGLGSDEWRLKWTGARPVVTRTANPHNLTLPAEHGLVAGQIRIEANRRELLGNVLFGCWVAPCVLTIAGDGKASFDSSQSGSLYVDPMYPVPLPPNHGLRADTVYNDGDPGRIFVLSGRPQTFGNVTVSCADGIGCRLYISSDGNAFVRRFGGIPTVIETGSPWRLASGLGLAAGEIMLEPGAWGIYNDVKVSCPTNGAACTVRVTADGTAHYDPAGGIPHLVPGYTPLVSALPSNHGSPAGEITIAIHPGTSSEYGSMAQVHGNVLIGCSNYIDTCRIAITKDGRVYRAKVGGIPWFQPVLARLPLAQGHGLAAGEIRLEPGVSTTRGGTSISCPAGGHACTLVVAKDGAANFQKTGNSPIVTVPHAYARENLWAEDLRDHWNEPDTLRDGMNLSAVDPSSATRAKNVLEMLLDDASGNPNNGGDKLRNVRLGDVEILGEKRGITYGQWKGGPAGTLDIEFALALVPGYLNLDLDESQKRALHAFAERHGKLWSRRLRDNFDKRVLKHDDGLGFAKGLTEDVVVDDILMLFHNECFTAGACALFLGLEATEDDFRPWAGEVGYAYSVMLKVLETLTRAPMSWIDDALTHEIGHALGITGLGVTVDGRSPPSVERYVNRRNHTFEGPEATKANGGNPVPFQWRKPGFGNAFPPRYSRG